MNTAVDQARDKLELWREYRQAFEEFAQAVDRVEALKATPNPSPAEIEASLLDREKAYGRYEDARDALAEALLSDCARNRLPMNSFPAPRENHGRVKDIAQKLWELEKRPEGKADDEWFRAENILRRAEASLPMRAAR